VAARGVTRRFGAATALDGVDLEVRAGEPVALFGINGAGKTTLLRVIAGGLRPDGGSVTVAGQNLRTAPASARGRVGYLSHQILLYDDLSARENLGFFARLHGVRDAPARAERLLDAVGLSERGDDPVRAFSRGMQQRVALARALLHDPVLLLLDEPSTGLDARSSKRLRAALRETAARGVTWLLATHDVDEGLDLCPRWIALDRGRVAEAGRSTGEGAERARTLVRGGA
jgi:heme ABC exporter ATP-binding subunit CcmA